MNNTQSAKDTNINRLDKIIVQNLIKSSLKQQQKPQHKYKYNAHGRNTQAESESERAKERERGGKRGYSTKRNE